MLSKKNILLSLTACALMGCGSNAIEERDAYKALEKEQEALMHKNKAPINFSLLNKIQESTTLKGDE